MVFSLERSLFFSSGRSQQGSLARWIVYLIDRSPYSRRKGRKSTSEAKLFLVQFMGPFDLPAFLLTIFYSSTSLRAGFFMLIVAARGGRIDKRDKLLFGGGNGIPQSKFLRAPNPFDAVMPYRQP